MLTVLDKRIFLGQNLTVVDSIGIYNPRQDRAGQREPGGWVHRPHVYFSRVPSARTSLATLGAYFATGACFD